MSDSAFIRGVGMHPFGRFPEVSIRQLAATAVDRALRDAEIGPEDVEIVFYSNAFSGVLNGQESVRGQSVAHHVGIREVPIINVENACSGGSTALWSAIRAVRSGEFKTALAIGAEKMFVNDRSMTLKALATASDTEMTGGQGLQFVAIYAMRIQDRLESGSLTPQHLAHVTIKNQYHGSLNPNAQFGKDLTVEEVLNARRIAGPLTLPMISGISDGAASVVVSSEPSGSIKVRAKASVLNSGSIDGLGPSATSRAINQAYEEASLGGADLDVAEVHDATAPSELLYYEQLGLCGDQEGGRFLEEGGSSLKGKTPVNPSGGLTARGHPVGATGLAQVCELTWQLRGEAGGRQVQDPRIALAQSSGGWLDGDSAATAVHILERL